MARLWRDYGLSIVLFTLFLVSWIGQTITGWFEFTAEQQSHGQVAAMFGAEGYVWPWAQATLENWQSEFLQLLTFVVLTCYLYHKGCHESKDGDERKGHVRCEGAAARLDALAKRLRRVEQRARHLHPLAVDFIVVAAGDAALLQHAIEQGVRFRIAPL